MDYFPLFLDLRGRRVLVVGEGEGAASRAAAVARAGAEVQLIRGFAPAMLDCAALVFVAGAQPAVSEEVARAAAAHGVPVNVMDEPRLCSFLMPAMVERGSLVVAIGTGGAAPMLARLLRQWLDRRLPQRLGALVDLAGRYRPLVKRRLPELGVRRRFWRRIFTGHVARLVLAGDDAGASTALRDALGDARHGASERDRAA